MRHGDIWRGLDELASRHGLSTSGLAKLAGLDATAFNKSKRQGKDGRLRWPSTESLSRVLEAVNENLSDFAALVSDRPGASLPSARLDEIQSSNFLDADGCLRGSEGRGSEALLLGVDPDTFVLEVTGNDFQPLYQPGERLVIAPRADMRDGHCALVKTLDGNLLVASVSRSAPDQSARFIGLVPSGVHLEQAEIAWASRILWRSQ